jgi:uncharacterized protein YjbJ (UPF0337 family)
MNRDERDGKAENVKGRVKEAAGIVTGDKELEKKGAQERAEGEARRNVGEARRKVGEAIEEVGKKVRR